VTYVTLCVMRVSSLYEENGSSYQHQTWYAHTVWQSFDMR